MTDEIPIQWNKLIVPFSCKSCRRWKLLWFTNLTLPLACITKKNELLNSGIRNIKLLMHLATIRLKACINSCFMLSPLYLDSVLVCEQTTRLDLCWPAVCDWLILRTQVEEYFRLSYLNVVSAKGQVFKSPISEYFAGFENLKTVSYSSLHMSAEILNMWT